MRHARNSISRSAVRVNRFLVRFDSQESNPYLNYAVPDDHIVPGRDDLAELTAAFAGRDRLPRLEFLPSLAPELEPRLREAGFDVEARLPLMVCGKNDLICPPEMDGVLLSAPATMDEYFATVEMQSAAFGSPGPITEHQVRAFLLDPLAGGGFAVTAWHGDMVAAAGMCGAAFEGVRDLNGIAVHPKWRRRGIGALVTGWLTARAHASGAETVWLDPLHPGATRMYQRVGFRVWSERLYMVKGSC